MQMTMRTPGKFQQSASRGLPGVVLHDISTGAWMIAVSDAGPNLDGLSSNHNEA